MLSIRKISALFMILVMLVSTTGFSMGTHFCMGELQSLTLFKEAPQCEFSAQTVPPCHGHVSFKHKNCCEDKTFTREALDNLAKTPTPQELHPELKYATLILPAYVVSSILARETYSITFLHYSPPLIELDIPVLVQSFLL